MNIHFTTRAEGIPDVTDHATRKALGLEKYLRSADTAQLYMDLSKDSEAHQQGDIWCAQINLDDDGRRYHANAHAENIEAAVARAISEVGGELRKAKALQRKVAKHDAHVLKQQMLGFSF